MNLIDKIEKDELEKMENNLEELSLYVINILQEYKKNGLIGDEDYKKHTKIKKEYLNFLEQKRKSSAAM